MKTTVLVVLLAVSIAANAALYFQRVSSATPADRGSAPNGASAGSAHTASQSATADPATAATQAEVAQLAQTWTRLQSGDLKTLALRLRTAGFSESMIRAIIGAQVNEQFAARRKALFAQQEETPYWSARQSFGLDPKTMSALRELSREQREQMKQLLGPDAAGNEEMQFYQRRQFGDLARDKVEQLQSIVGDYSDLRRQIYSAANGVMLPEDREKLALLEKEQRTDLAALLTPQELENYELRSSSLASVLRSQLGTFRPTEEEFRALFRATRAAEEQFGSLSNAGPNPNVYRQAQTAVLEQAKSFLTSERLADLKQATDPAYQMVNRLVARLELPASAAIQVVAVQQDITKRVGAMRSDQNLTPEQRNAQFSVLLQEATASLTNALGGARGFEAYKQYGGQWLQNLQPRPAPSPRG